MATTQDVVEDVMAAGNRVPRNGIEAGKSSGTPPCLKLKALRTRAGITAIVAAKACKLSSPNSFYRYEAVERMGDTPIPDHIIEAILPLMVGRGHPPVTADELLAISSAHRLLAKGKSNVTTARILPQPMTAPIKEQQLSLPLVVRYRPEQGVYMDSQAVDTRTYGTAPIVALPEVQGEQFSAALADGSGVILHCVHPSAYTSEGVIGKRVVVVHERAGLGLSEVMVARVTALRGNHYVMEDEKGKPVDGEVRGVVIGSYARE